MSKYANLFSSLYGSGNWTLLDLKKLAGLNFLRVWREVEKVQIAEEVSEKYIFCPQVGRTLGGGANEERIPEEENQVIIKSTKVFSCNCKMLRRAETVAR